MQMTVGLKVTPAKQGKARKSRNVFNEKCNNLKLQLSPLHTAESGAKPNQTEIVCRVLR